MIFEPSVSEPPQGGQQHVVLTPIRLSELTLSLHVSDTMRPTQAHCWAHPAPIGRRRSGGSQALRFDLTREPCPPTPSSGVFTGCMRARSNRSWQTAPLDSSLLQSESRCLPGELIAPRTASELCDPAPVPPPPPLTQWGGILRIPSHTVKFTHRVSVSGAEALEIEGFGWTALSDTCLSPCMPVWPVRVWKTLFP